MRLWHESLIKKLPRQQLLGQHRECCALRGKGWGKPHSTVNYVFNYSPYKLFQYHL
ncbi:pyrimidine dimer DNA glycosylase/endonuclease V, partial [Lactococcus sp.]